MKILIAVPTYENIYPDTYKSIYNLLTGDHECDFSFVRGYDCARARNNIAQGALGGGFDYVLMVDNDVVLPRDALLTMLEDNVEVCLGYYAHRNVDNIYNGKTSVCRLGEFNYTWQYPAVELKELRDKGEHLIQIHGGGMGCALIHTSVFQTMNYPYFKWVNYDNGSVLSEDLYFCEQCKNYSIPIYTDTRIACGHLIRHVQWPE